MTTFGKFSRWLLMPAIAGFVFFAPHEKAWESRFVKPNKQGTLDYAPDEKGNIIPDFSRVGYHFGDKAIPTVPVVKEVSPSGTGDDQSRIQAAIDEVSARKPDAGGFRGAVLLKKGTYKIAQNIRITKSGVVLRGEGNTAEGTRLIALSDKQVSLIQVEGEGQVNEERGTRTRITDKYVPVGAFVFQVQNASRFKKGDRIIVLRPGTQNWIHDLKMDQIEDRGGTRQWEPRSYDLRYERTIVKIERNKITVDNPMVIALDEQYGGGEIYRYSFDGRITECGVENLYCESVYASDTAENHAWNAIAFAKVENGWVRQVTSRYFGNSGVTLRKDTRNVSVLDSYCFDAKSIITGSRRYSFNNDGQLNLFVNCHATEGRHDFVTGAVVCGPNVFVHCTAKNTHADIGPHHRWASGTLYDNIVTDGEINVQDRGNWGSGHGWAGVTQVLWNCTVKRAAIQNPWVSGKNYCIGLQGEKYDGRLKGRPDAEWEGQNRPGIQPASLYDAQLAARRKQR
ncbi:hypothetical protein ACWKWU_16540 [Chitinophaga lutea]